MALRARSSTKSTGGRGCAPALVCSPQRHHALLPTPPSPHITLAPTLPQQSSNPAGPKGRKHGTHHVVAAVSSAAPQVPEVSTEALSNTVRRATITVPASMVKAMFKKSKDYLEKQVVGSMNGWQAGKPLPLAVVIDQVGGQQNFKSFLIEELLMDTMPKALGSLASAIVPESERIVTPAAKLAEMYDPARELSYIVQYEVFPELKWRRPYKEAEVTIQDTGDFSTDAAAVEDLVRQYLKRDGGFKRVVVGRGLEKGDLAIIDMEVRLRDGILPLPGLKKDKMALDTEADPLNLKKGMKGMKPGEERKFTTTFPKDYPVELWQGLEADVRVKMHELFTWSLPELDDAYVAAHFGDKFKTAEEMRRSLLATTAMLRVQALDKQLEDGVVGAVVSCLEPVDVPDSMVKSNAERQYQQALLAMMQDRVAKPEDIEKLMKPAMLDEYIQRRRPQLEEVCLFNLAVNYIFDQEKLTVDEKDIEEEFKGRLAAYKADANSEVDADSVRMEVTETFRSIAVIEWLKDNVKRNVLPYVPPPADA